MKTSSRKNGRYPPKNVSLVSVKIMGAVELKINADVAQEEVSEVIDNDYNYRHLRINPGQR